MHKLPLYDKINYYLVKKDTTVSQFLCALVMLIFPVVAIIAALFLLRDFSLISSLFFIIGILIFLPEIPLLIQISAEGGNKYAKSIESHGGYISMFLLAISLICLTYGIHLIGILLDLFILMYYMIKLLIGNHHLNNNDIKENIIKKHKSLIKHLKMNK